MPTIRVDVTSFREKQETVIDREGRVVRSEGRRTPTLPRQLSRPQAARASQLAAMIDQRLAEAQVGGQGAGGGKISVTVGRVRVERPVFHAQRESAQIARELRGSLR